MTISGGIPVTGFSCVSSICTANVAGLPAGLMPRQFYVNGQRAIRARTDLGLPVNANYVRGSTGYTQIVPPISLRIPSWSKPSRRHSGK